MAKGQKKSNREIKKPKKTAAEKAKPSMSSTFADARPKPGAKKG